MNQDPNKVMLSVSCGPRNAANALASIVLFSAAVAREENPDFEMCLGLELAGDRREPAVNRILAMARDAWPSEIYFWDTCCDDILLSRLEPDFPKPFSSGFFSYGAAANKRLLLAAMAKCDFLFRYDPGLMVSPHDGINSVLNVPLTKFDEKANLKFLSGRYEGRLAARTENICDDKRDEYLEVLKEYTGIDPWNQLTGGISVMRVADTGGTPFIAFEPFEKNLTLVWGSDDGVMKRLYKNETHVMADWALPRFDPVGYPKNPNEYFLGIAGMVALDALIQKDNIEGAKARVKRFIAEFNQRQLLDPTKKVNKKQSALADTLVPVAFLEKVEQGWTNYCQLTKRWLDLVDIAGKCFSGDRKALHLIDT